MAKPKGPLFSLSATQTIAKTLTFAGHKGLTVAKRIPTHPDAQTAAQLAHRLIYSHARDYWLTCGPQERAQLLRDARPDKMTGYNRIIRRFILDLLDLDAWWPLNDPLSATPQDFSLHNQHGHNIGCTPGDDYCGFGGNAYFFDGLNDYVWATAPHLNYTTQPFTLTFRFRTRDLGAFRYIFSRGADSVEGYGIWCGPPPRILVHTSQLGIAQSSTSSVGAIAIDTWYTIGVTFQIPSVYIYIDGVFDPGVPAVHIAPAASARTVKLGVLDNLAGAWLPGRMCDVRAYGRALTPAEHLTVHQRYCVHPLR